MPRVRTGKFDDSTFHSAPGNGASHDLDAILRIAKAAEYSAAQLAAIARSVEKIESRLSKIESDDHEDEDNLVYRVRSRPRNAI